MTNVKINHKNVKDEKISEARFMRLKDTEDSRNKLEACFMSLK